MYKNESFETAYNRRLMLMYDRDRKNQQAIEDRRNFIKNKNEKER